MKQKKILQNLVCLFVSRLSFDFVSLHRLLSLSSDSICPSPPMHSIEYRSFRLNGFTTFIYSPTHLNIRSRSNILFMSYGLWSSMRVRAALNIFLFSFFVLLSSLTTNKNEKNKKRNERLRLHNVCAVILVLHQPLVVSFRCFSFPLACADRSSHTHNHVHRHSHTYTHTHDCRRCCRHRRLQYSGHFVYKHKPF